MYTKWHGQENDLTDLREIVIQAKLGNRSALGVLCTALHRHIEWTIRKRVPNDHALEDLIQDAYLELIKGIQTIEKPNSIRNFVGQIATNVANRHLRHRYKWGFIIGGYEEETIQPANVPPDDPIDKVALQEAISAIPDQIDKQLIVLRLRGKTYREVAHALGITEGAAKMRMKRTLDSLSEIRS